MSQFVKQSFCLQMLENHFLLSHLTVILKRVRCSFDRVKIEICSPSRGNNICSLFMFNLMTYSLVSHSATYQLQAVAMDKMKSEPNHF